MIIEPVGDQGKIQFWIPFSLTSSFKLVLLSAIILFANSLFAQNRRTKTTKIAREQTEWMASVLDLDGIQIKKAGLINLKYAEKIEEAMERNKWNPEGEEEEIARYKLERCIELKKIFTDEQWNTYERFKLKKGAHRK